jgi:hypothetical protein
VEFSPAILPVILVALDFEKALNGRAVGLEVFVIIE